MVSLMGERGGCIRAEMQRWRDEKSAEVRERAKTDEPLAHLLAVLDAAADIMREIGCDVDAVVLDSHRAQLVAGREWPGQPITSPFPPDLAVAEQAEGKGSK